MSLCLCRRIHTAALPPRSAASPVAALCLFLGACNVPVLSPEERAAIDTIGPAIARQEQANAKLEALTSKVEANVQAGRDANVKQEQSLAKLDANIQTQDVAVAQFKGEIAALKVVTSQSAGRDQTNPTGLLNFIIQSSKGHEDGIATATTGIAAVLALWRALRRRAIQAKTAQEKVDILVRGVESASEKLEDWFNEKAKNGDPPPDLDPKIVKDEVKRVATLHGKDEAIDAEARKMKPRKRG